MNDQATSVQFQIRRFCTSFGAVMNYLENIAQARKTGESTFIDVWISGARQELETAFDNLPEPSRAEVLQVLRQLSTQKDLMPPEKRMVKRSD